MNRTQYKKQYRKDNIDKIKEQDRLYRLKNAEIIKENRLKNKDKYKYNNIIYAKIYRLFCNKTLKQYYGSTCEKNLSRRLQKHEKDFINFFEKENSIYMSSFEVICEGDYKIELVENVKCKNVKDLKKRERWYIENNKCVNINVPTRNDKTKQKYECKICGSIITRAKKSRHEKTKKHLNKA